MNRAGLRALVLVALAATLWSFVGFGLTADGLAQVEAIASGDLILTEAAGLALIDYYAANKTADELAELLAAALTPGQEIAAQGAIDKQTGAVEALLAEYQANEDAEAALAALLDKAMNGATASEREAAARVYYLVMGMPNNREALEAEVAKTDISDEMAYVAGQLLGANYIIFAPTKTADELKALAVEGATYGLRVAGGTGYAQSIAGTHEYTIRDLETLILEHTLWHEELADAYRILVSILYKKL